jgi:hypothetical protein
MRTSPLRGLWVVAATLCLTTTVAQAQGRARGNEGTPPGLAKKGGLPPGQAKKVYRPDEGVIVLRDIFSSHGLIIVRTVSSGDARIVYYRSSAGPVRRAVVRPGAERPTFENVPAAMLREVLAKLH